MEVVRAQKLGQTSQFTSHMDLRVFEAGKFGVREKRKTVPLSPDYYLLTTIMEGEK